jgi:hypothetical protein
MKMATKKIELGMNIDDFPMPSAGTITQAPATITQAPDTERHDFAVAALQTLDWNQIGMGVDQAAKLCWSMAEAMIRNKP